MNISDTNPNLPSLRPLTRSQKNKRRMSCSTNSKSTHSSSVLSSTQSKDLNSIPILIKLCFHPNENYAYQTMQTLFSRYRYSLNVCDEFHCNVLMYTLRYQRIQLFDFLLNDISLDLNLRSKDRQGNNILHYAIIYGKDDTQIMENLIEKFNKFGIDIDERNSFGFTPLLLAAFCGRYDLALALLTNTDASPFVRDYIQLKNLLDYVELDTKQKEFIKKPETNRPSSQSPRLSRESIRLRIQLHQTLHPRLETQHHSNKNFFENILPEAVRDYSGSTRSSILTMYNADYLSSDLTCLIHYISRRYPQINTQKNQDNVQDITTTTKFVLQRENSKTNLHNIFSLFDPDLRSKAILSKGLTAQSIQPLDKTPTAFKRLGTRLTVVGALSRPQIGSKTSRSLSTTSTK